MAIFPGSAIPSAVSDYEIENSLRFDNGDSSYLKRTFTTGNRKVWTLSTWLKPCCNTNAEAELLSVYSGGSDTDYTSIYREVDTLVVSGWANRFRKTLRLFRDPAAWYHIVIVWDTPNDTAVDRCQIYVNGDKVTGWDINYAITEDVDGGVNIASPHWIGYEDSASRYSSMYLAEYYFIDGTALTPSSFGELDSTTNQWIPLDSDTVKDAVTFGTNGFYQKYSSTELAASFTDSAENNTVKTVTRYGNIVTKTGTKKIGTASAYFNGTSGTKNTLAVEPADAKGGFISDADGKFTIDAWVYCSSSGSGQENAIVSQGKSGNYWMLRWNEHNTEGKCRWYSTQNGSNATDISHLAGAGFNDNWHHFSVTYDNSTVTLWVDGANAGTDSISNMDCGYWDGFHLRVGTNPYAADDSEELPMYGYIDELIISRGIVRHTAAFTPSTTAFTADQYTTLLMHMDGSDDGTSFPDASWTGAPRHSITANGDVTNTRAVRKIGESSIKFDGTGDYLNIPNSTDWQFSDEFTIEGFVRKPDMATVGDIFTIYGGGGGGGNAGFQIFVGNNAGGSGIDCYFSSDGSAWTNVQEDYTWSNDTWYHLAVTRDSSDDVHIWVNGTEVGSGTSFTGTVANPAAYDTLSFGARTDTSSNQWEGYMDEIRISNTDRYPSAFTPTTTEFTADANTLLLIHSNWGGGLGADSSGNYNNFTATNLVATDQMIDTPTNNWCTMNPLAKASDSYNTLKEGNLHLETTGQGSVMSTFAMSAGKWYWECLVTIEPTWWPVVGFGKTTTPVGVGNQNYTGEQAGSWGYLTETGAWYVDGSTSSTYTAVSAGDIMQFAIDMDAGKAWVGINNTWVNSGAPASGTNAIVTSGLTGDIVPIFSDSDGAGHDLVANFGQDSSFAGAKTAQSKQDSNEVGDFYYEPPSLFLALCTSNLPDPAIALPGDNFNTVLYTGDDSSNRAITGVGFAPDLVWVKDRDAIYWHQLHDSVRGIAGGPLYSNANNAEDPTYKFDSFDSDGFTTGSEDNAINTASDSIVAWNWKAGGAAVSNGDGDITSSVSANTTAGFSIVSYTGDGDNTSSVGHGLTTTPGMILLKALTGTQNWIVWHKNLTATTGKSLYLNTSAAEVSNTSYWYDAAPNATTFHPGNGGASNGNTTEYIAYCFEEIEGYSKMGSYVNISGAATNGEGNFIYTGFKPAWFLNKMISGPDSAGGWFLYDNKRNAYNLTGTYLVPNENYADEVATQGWDFLSNGIKLRASFSANTHIYMAFAESPFKYSNAR